jgi:hypothetical protein
MYNSAYTQGLGAIAKILADFLALSLNFSKTGPKFDLIY